MELLVAGGGTTEPSTAGNQRSLSKRGCVAGGGTTEPSTAGYQRSLSKRGCGVACSRWKNNGTLYIQKHLTHLKAASEKNSFV